MRNHKLQLIALLGLAVFCHSIAVSSINRKKNKKAKVENVVRDTLSYEQDSIFGVRFHDAMKYREAGKTDSAKLLIDSCLMINPQSAVAHFLRAEYLAEENKDSLALVNFKMAAKLEPSNDTYQERVAQMNISTGDYNGAMKAYERLYSSNHDRDDVLAILIQLYRQQKDYNKMLDAINRLEQVDGTSDQLSLMKMNAYELNGNVKGAYNTLKGLSDSHPNDANFKLMLGNWLIQHNRSQEAYDIYQAVLKEEPDNAMAQSSMYDYYNAIGKDSLANNMMDRILLGKATPSATRLQFFRMAIANNEQANGDSTEIIDLIAKIQKIVPKDTTMAQMKAAYYTLKKLPVDSINKSLTDLLKLQPDNAGARMQLIQNKWSKQNWKEIASLSEPGMLYNPNEMAFYFFTGLSRYYLKDDDGALNALKRGTAEINDQSNPDIVADLYSIMGEIYHTKGLNQDAYAAYDSCLQYKPDNYGTLNNYAYFLSVDGVNLDKAEQMSAKAIAAEPKNATYLDTYAWILYKLGRYADAKIYIDQTMKFTTDSTSDATLYEHAAEIYAALGNYKDAVSFCQKAVKHGGNVKTLNRKIKAYRKKIK